jgi:hypothetical protein
MHHTACFPATAIQLVLTQRAAPVPGPEVTAAPAAFTLERASQCGFTDSVQFVQFV